MTCLLPSSLTQIRSTLVWFCTVEGRADWAQGLREEEEFSLCSVLPACWDHPPEANAGIGSDGHWNNKTTRKEPVVYK